jgi:hypothetical protein
MRRFKSVWVKDSSHPTWIHPRQPQEDKSKIMEKYPQLFPKISHDG